MNTSTFQTYQTASELQAQARETMNRLELLADHGVKRAEQLLNTAWNRYNRRAVTTDKAASRHWGSL